MTATTTSTTTASTSTSTATATYSSFYIAASDSAVVPDGSTLDDEYSFLQAQGTGRFNNGVATVFALYASSGTLYDIRNDALATYNSDNPSEFFFASQGITANEPSTVTQCLCQVDSFALVLSCNCDGTTVFQTDSDNNVYIDTQVDSGNYAITLVIQPILD